MKTLAILLAAAPLAGCISFGAKPPPTLLTLSSTASVPVGQVITSAGAKGLTVDIPVTPAALASARIPVQASATSIAYIKDTAWAEPPARLFARLVSDTVAARTGRVVLSSVQAIDTPSAVLAGELRNFGLDASTREAVVTFDAALRREGTDAAVEKRRFEARVPVTAIDAVSAGPALNEAANRVAGEVADWVGR